tara:strand:- start:10064 stop:10381 length:318 start_codon:yes stop_codon:yes gene_type:complete
MSHSAWLPGARAADFPLVAERKAKAGRSGVLGPPVGRRGQDAGGLSGRRPWAGKGGFTGSRSTPGVAVKLEHSGSGLAATAVAGGQWRPAVHVHAQPSFAASGEL